jgi:hypothetical protein
MLLADNDGSYPEAVLVCEFRLIGRFAQLLY